MGCTAKKKIFFKGFKDALPIFLGYFAVSFTLGITAKNAGLSVFQAALMSFLNSTSAGEAAALDIIKNNGTYLEIAISQLIINLRYFLMSAALAVKLKDKSTVKRLFMALGVTDEIFGLSIKQEELSPFYTLGCFSFALPGWVLGTALGVVFGNILPAIITSALSMDLYSMFIAIIIPDAKKDIKIAILIIISMASSFIFYKFIPSISSGMRVIILTVALSVIFAILFPISNKEEETK